MRISVSFSGFGPIETTLRTARAAEAAGLDGVWYCEHVGFRDAVVPASVMLDRHPDLDVGLVGPAPVSRHPAVLAMELADLSELGPGRVRAQLGLGDARLVGRIGGVSGSLAHVREYVEATRMALAGEPLTGKWAGHVFDGYQTLARPEPPALDVMAIRPKMLELSARVADGVSLSTGASVEYLSASVQRIEQILEECGRERGSFRVTAQAFGTLADTQKDAEDRLRPTLGIFSPDILGILAPNCAPAEDVARMAIATTPERLAERLAEYRDAGVDEIALDLSAPDDEIEDIMRVFATARTV
ncbi:LLM class flavin-dependent oxidoreductase [Microbacterium saperdae]|uniref:Alkanesulfonate monooxygenase SsuD/methylene tetrahydromethanopterin reductase-like flavin-dependent oxidoreductase (Luciferase family) n=1 Tax=Microbacterium saperdae TaxID=69368 RepID=A0A543BLA1_9MICO|nr:LLM class flavin-dependent oxidoreductase [Microbacterium saperdae]TQL85584.1 alkanesulfonate monooxygenase SsuD/methylene tetrahydromethanopterin reductase-like flavin-dependent oxidoreductase (luciferase family) [Microbacterium saperdae]GGM62531.1 5,10-methylenetetrahydromethanopterin reductase [Microbacterium saperdae]